MTRALLVHDRRPRSCADAGRRRPRRWPGTLHAVEHAAIGMLPLFTICDRWDVGGVSTPWLGRHRAPDDRHLRRLPRRRRHRRARLRGGRPPPARPRSRCIEACPCDDGCPSCVQSPKCGNGNEPLDKAGAIALLRALASAERTDARRPGPRRGTALRAGGVAHRLDPHGGRRAVRSTSGTQRTDERQVGAAR